MKVFVVDDDQLSGRLLTSALEHEGLETVTCRSGSEALQKLREEGPALLVLDYEMPDLNGAEICALVRQDPDPKIAEIPILLVTAHSGVENELKCLKAGADDFVTKPVNLAILKARITTHLRLYSLRHQLQKQNDELTRYRSENEMDLESARLTQLAIIPTRMPDLSGWNLAAFLKPLIQVGGDIYDLRRLPDRLLLWISDATGHGTSAALLTTLSKLLFRHASAEESTPSSILRLVHEEFFAVFRGKQFMTACCVVLDPVSGKIAASGAGHPPVLIRRTSRNTSILRSSAPPIGIPVDVHFSEEEAELQPGDALLIHTDGLYDIAAPGRKRLTPESLADLLPSSASTAQEFLDHAIRNVRRHCNDAPFSDDVAAIAALKL